MPQESDHPGLFSRDSREREDLLDAFERCWHAGCPRPIEMVVEGFAGDRAMLIAELAGTELELRWKRGDPARVEEYTARFEELGENAGAVIDLIVAEWGLRQRAGIPVDLVDFYRRFPEESERLAKQRLLIRIPRETQLPTHGRRTFLLDVFQGPERNRRRTFVEDHVLVGRSAESGFQLDRDLHLSRTHFKLEWIDDALWLRDLGSHNGTALNGTPAAETSLNDGDVIAAGTTRMAVLMPR